MGACAPKSSELYENNPGESDWPVWALGASASSRYGGQQSAASVELGGYSCKTGQANPKGSNRMKALLVGCDYRGTEFEALGCCNAVHEMRDFLKLEYSLTKTSIRELLDDQATVINILNGISWLTAGAKPGDALMFLFSGHGSQQKSPPGHVSARMALLSDQFEDTIVPRDFQVAGQISDAVLTDRLVANLPSGVQLTAIFDCCHHAVSLDLPFRWSDTTIQGAGSLSHTEESPDGCLITEADKHEFWETIENPYYCPADVQSISCCERWQEKCGDREQRLIPCIVDIMSRVKEPAFTKLMRKLKGLLADSLAEPLTLLSSQKFDNALKRFSPNGRSIVSNTNTVLWREWDKVGGELCLPTEDPLCPSARQDRQSADTLQDASLPNFPMERYQYADGTVYDGEWTNYPGGLRRGHGASMDAKGQMFVGQWLDGVQDGTGEQVWSDGSRYEGSYSRGKKNGQGRCWWPNGSEYIGQFKEDKFDGEGSYRWRDGRKFRGQWTDNKMNGSGFYTWKFGEFSSFRGMYSDGRRHGEGQLQKRDGTVITGQWQEGVLVARTGNL